MRRNTFFLLIGVVGVLLAGVLWASVELATPTLIQVAFLIAVPVIWAAKRHSVETIRDERTSVMTQRATVATLFAFWIIFFLVSIGSVVWEFSRPLGILPPPPAGIVQPEGPPSRTSRAAAAGPAGADDRPVRRLPDLLRAQVRGLGVG